MIEAEKNFLGHLRQTTGVRVHGAFGLAGGPDV